MRKNFNLVVVNGFGEPQNVSVLPDFMRHFFIPFNVHYVHHMCIASFRWKALVSEWMCVCHRECIPLNMMHSVHPAEEEKNQIVKFDHSIETNCITLIKCTISFLWRFSFDLSFGSCVFFHSSSFLFVFIWFFPLKNHLFDLKDDFPLCKWCIKSGRRDHHFFNNLLDNVKSIGHKCNVKLFHKVLIIR